MGYLGRRIGKSQDTGNPTADGTGGGLLDLFTSGYFQRQGNIYNEPGIILQGLTATGGVISDYVDGSNVYRAHIFTSSGTFTVSALGTFGSNVEYLVVAGGGAGGSGSYRLCGGGGAGGLLSNHPDVPASAPTGATRQAAYPVSPGSYTVSIGAGGAGATNGTIVDGSASNFYPTPVSYPSPTYLRAFGGGGGGGNPNPGSNAGTNTSGNPGGSGGGNTEGGSGISFLIGGGGSGTTGQGSNGGRTGSGWGGAGGGGAGEAGCQDDNGPIPANPPGAYSNGGYGGDGMQVRIAGSPLSDQPVGTPGTNPGGGYFAGGGGGSYQPNTNAPLKGVGGEGGGGYGIVWPGGVNPFGQDGLSSTGGGGGGAAEQTGPARGGNGGSGIVVVRYQIAQLTATAKATGGAISYYGGKTIHTFLSSGTFTTTSAIPSAQVLVVGGGGGGSFGGGGAGGVFYDNSFPMPAPTAYSITIGAGGQGANKGISINGGNAGTNSTFNPGPSVFTGNGGGAGGGVNPTAPNPNYGNGGPGGSGGGGGHGSGQNSGGPASQPGNTRPNAPTQTNYGYAGGNGSAPTLNAGGGGGGAGGAGGNAGPLEPQGGIGGPGIGSPTIPWLPPAVSPDGYLAGGGGGGFLPGGVGGQGGGGDAGPTLGGNASSGRMSTGGGGGGTNNNPGTYIAGSGGSGIVLIAYPS